MNKSPASAFLLLLAFIVATFLSIPHTAEAVTTSKWYKKASSFEKIEKAAKQKDKPYIVFFYTDWCGYCKKMNKKYLSNTKVKKVLSKYYRIKIKTDGSEKAKALAHRKGVHGIPDFRVVHPDGRNLRIHPFGKNGAVEVETFIKALKAALKG
ncbi:thioredoxin family protein [Candidatus Electrothrix sp.]|uniref:thioredoxin family protein n=1 Tax=Candidatus Electrothrix sp. TaxID=2170559 RepID=UPI004055BBE2